MTTKLNKTGLQHAKHLIDQGKVVHDQRDDWSEHQPTAAQENEFIESHGWAEYGAWHLGVDETAPDDTKKHYSFPYGDFKRVHRCAVITIESRAGQYKHLDIERAAADLHGLIDKVKHPVP